MSGRLLTAREVADRFAVNPETILRWWRQGILPGVRLSNRAVRFREEDVDAFEQERATPQRGSVSHHAGRRPAGNGSLMGVSHHSNEEP